MGITHAKVSAKADTADATKVQPSDWNAGHIIALAASDIPSGIDAAKISAGSVSNAEFDYLDGLTSNIQTQLNAKDPLAEVTLTAAQINSLNSTPYTLVAAQGATKVIVPVSLMVHMIRSANVFSADPGFRLRWAGLATDLMNSFSMGLTSAAPPNPTDGFRQAVMSMFWPGYASDPRNAGLQFSASVDTTGGSGATLAISVSYFVATL